MQSTYYQEMGQKPKIFFTEKDFDFDKNWDELNLDAQADFASFTKTDCNFDAKESWEYYQRKNKEF